MEDGSFAPTLLLQDSLRHLKCPAPLYYGGGLSTGLFGKLRSACQHLHFNWVPWEMVPEFSVQESYGNQGGL